MNIPYETVPHPSTGATNARLGMALFIASEVMLFGGMMTSWVFLRESTSTWAGGAGALSLSPAVVNTALIGSSSLAMALARRRIVRGGGGTALISAALLAGALFVAHTFVMFGEAAGRGFVPAASTFAGIWYAITGLHGLHVAAGVALNAMLVGPWRRASRADRPRYGNRVDVSALYWHFLAVSWLATAAALYFVG